MTQVAAHLLDEVRSRLATGSGELTPHRVAEALRAAGRPVGDATVLAVHDALRRDVLGAGPLEPLLRLPDVTDVLVNGPDQVWVERPGDWSSPVSASPTTARCVGSPNDWRPPGVAGSTTPRPTSTSGCLTAPASTPCSPRRRGPGTVISLRLVRDRGFTLDELVDSGPCRPTAPGCWPRWSRPGSRSSSPAAPARARPPCCPRCCRATDPRERLVLVEDSSELRPDHPHVVGLEARPANVEGAGEVTLRDLVRQALRMRPDRLVVGEVRGAEVVELLAALNTGHEGGCGTLHANSAADVPARVEALALAAGLPREAAHSQLGAALDVVVHLGRDRDGRRRVRELAVPVRSADGLVSMVTAVTIGESLAEGPGADLLATTIAERA